MGKWKINLSEKEFWDYWFKEEKPSSEMIELAKRLKSLGIKIILLSNNFKERAQYYGHYPWIHEVVDRAYFSYQTGLVKPDVLVWQLALDENGLKSEECLYFDDQEKNIQSAKSLGIKSFLYKDPIETLKIISGVVIAT